MMNLDISTLAILPSGQSDMARYLAQALNLGRYNLPSRYILQHVPWDLSNVSNASFTRYFYPDVPAAQAASRSAGDGHDPVFVGEVELIFIPTTLTGGYTITVTIHSITPQNPDLETQIFYASPVANTLVPNQVSRVVFPYIPTLETSIEVASTEAGGRVDFSARIAYNGLFFTGL